MEAPFNIYAMAEASDFIFGTQLGFAKAHHKITPRRKISSGLGSTSKFGGYPLIFLHGMHLYKIWSLFFLQWLKLQWFFIYTILNRKTENVNEKNRVYVQVSQTYTSKTANIGTVNLVSEHVGVVTMCSTTKFTVPIFTVFDV